MTAAATAAPTIDIIRFLLARIDEEDQALRTRVRRARRTVEHLHDPDHAANDRVFEQSLRDLVARRQVLGDLQHLLVLRDLPNEKPVRDTATHILQSLAVPYGGHVQYRSAWRPSLR